MRFVLYLAFVLLFSCKGTKSLTADKHSYPNPVDTTTRPIQLQQKKTYIIGGLSATNDFPAARLNKFLQENDSTYIARIWPENFPINPSPWYAFKLWSKTEREIYLKLDYSNGAKHRYTPKLSKDGERWSPLDTTLLQLNQDSTSATVRLRVGKDTLWVAAQEIQDYKRVGAWVHKMAQNPIVQNEVAGKSAFGRDLYHLNIYKGTDYKKRPTVLIISRQHPPEVTGYLCMKAFVETLIDEGATNGFF